MRLAHYFVRLLELGIAIPAAKSQCFISSDTPDRVGYFSPRTAEIYGFPIRIPLSDPQPNMDNIVLADVFGFALWTAKSGSDSFRELLGTTAALLDVLLHAKTTVCSTRTLKVWVA